MIAQPLYPFFHSLSLWQSFDILLCCVLVCVCVFMLFRSALLPRRTCVAGERRKVPSKSRHKIGNITNFIHIIDNCVHPHYTHTHTAFQRLHVRPRGGFSPTVFRENIICTMQSRIIALTFLLLLPFPLLWRRNKSATENYTRFPTS